MATRPDAVIIGAGIIGNSIATELTRRGWRTLSIDKLARAGSGSTSYSSGILRTTYSIVDSCAFSWEGYTYYDAWDEHIRTACEGGYARMRSCGQLLLRSSAAEPFLSRTLECHEKLGLPYEEWDAQMLRERCGFDLTSFAPPRRIDDDLFGSQSSEPPISSAVFFPTAGYVTDPQLAARNLSDAATATGKADFLFGAVVTAITRSGDRVSGVRLADGSEIDAPVVINAAGPHSSIVNCLAFPDPLENDMQVTTRPMRQEVAYVPIPASGDAWRPAADCKADVGKADDGPYGPVVTDLDVGVYWRPEVGNKLLIGTVEPVRVAGSRPLRLRAGCPPAARPPLACSYRARHVAFCVPLFCRRAMTSGSGIRPIRRPSIRAGATPLSAISGRTKSTGQRFACHLCLCPTPPTPKASPLAMT